MADYQIQPNKSKTIFYITYRTKRPEGGLKKNYLHNDEGMIVSFDNEDKANIYRTSLRAKEDAKNDLKVLREKMNKKYGNHNDYTTSYLKQKKKEAPKSFQRSEWHLVHYVFPFFLFEKHIGNANSWPLYFDEFKDWLEESTSIRKNKLSGGSKLTISSINKIIGDLNGYLNHLYKKRNLLMLPPKCEYFTGAEDGYRSGDDIVEAEEYNLICNHFRRLIDEKEIQKDNAENLVMFTNIEEAIVRLKETLDLYIICRHTGMRISEALGLGFGDFYPYPIEDKNLAKLIKKNDLEPLSYLILESQKGDYDEENEKWKREPLKTKKTISLDNTRTIPIFSNQVECDDLLRKKFFEARDFYNITNLDELRRNKGQFLFFRNINKNIASGYLKKVYSDLAGKLEKWKSFHCLRHTRATELISQTHDATLLKLILGHKSRVYERYVHLESTLAKKLTKDKESNLLSFKRDKAV
jgi:integrase